MVDRETIERRLLRLEQFLRKLKELSKVNLDEYLKNEAAHVVNSSFSVRYKELFRLFCSFQEACTGFF